jgi:hypothetical protein
MLIAIMAFLRPKLVLFLAVFFVPWLGLGYDLGLTILPHDLFMGPLLVVVLAKYLINYQSKRKFSGIGSFWLILLYALTWSLVQIPLLPEASILGGQARSPAFRAFAQILKFILVVSPIFVICVITRTKGDFPQIARVYISSVLILCVLGWIQILAWYFSGSDPMPVGWFNNLVSGSGALRSGSFIYEGQTIIRMSSLGGEPKGLGSSIVVALLVMQAIGATRSIKYWYCWFFLIISLLLTFSTTAMLGWVGATLVQSLVPVRSRISSIKLRHKRVRFMVVSFVAVSVLFSSVVPIRTGGPILWGLLEYRTIDRIHYSRSGLLEDFNVAVVGYLSDYPLHILSGVGLGNIHLYAGSYLPPEAKHYATGTAFVAKSGALRWISELGVISFLALLFWSVFVTKRLRRRALLEGVQSSSIVIEKSLLGVTAFWIVSGYVLAHYFFLLGVLYGMCRFSSGRSVNRVEVQRVLRETN